MKSVFPCNLVTNNYNHLKTGHGLEVPLKLKIELSYDPAFPLLGTYPEKTNTLIQKDTWTSTFTAALFIIAKTWTQPKCLPRKEWIKMWYRLFMESKKWYKWTYVQNRKGLTDRENKHSYQGGKEVKRIN